MIKQEKLSKSYPMLTSDLKKANLSEYELGVILVLADEYKASYKKVTVHDADDSGTEIEYVILRSEDEKEEYKHYLINLIEKFKSKYNKWDLMNVLDIE